MIMYGARLEIPSVAMGREQLRAEEFEDTSMIANVSFMLSTLLEIYVKRSKIFLFRSNFTNEFF